MPYHKILVTYCDSGCCSGPHIYEYMENFDIYYNKKKGTMFVYNDPEKNYLPIYSADELVELFGLCHKEKIWTHMNCAELSEIRINPEDLEKGRVSVKYYGSDCEYGYTHIILNLTNKMINDEIDLMEEKSVSTLKFNMKNIVPKIVNKYKIDNRIDEITFTSE